jgi:hypothetical protein
MGDHALTIRVDLEPGAALANLHSRSAFLLGDFRPSASRFSLTGKALPCSRTRWRPYSGERSRLG